MDTVTHLALGAVIGEAYFKNDIGKKALVIGAAAQFFPDIDIIASLWLSPADNLLAHRGITHSFFFAVAASILFAWILNRFVDNTITYRRWTGFILLQLMTHNVIDGFNAYGTAWLLPFSDTRISFHTLYVADPFYTVWLVIGAVGLFWMNSSHYQRKKWMIAALIISSGYLLYAIGNKLIVNKKIEQSIINNNITPSRHFSTPSPFNVWLWFVVVEEGDGYQIGYQSVFDDYDTIAFTYFPKQDTLLQRVADKHAVAQLKFFSNGYYTVENRNGELIFNDLRFEQITGWHNPRAPFVFHYYLDKREENLMVMQRGRFENWNEETIHALLQRIKGN